MRFNFLSVLDSNLLGSSYFNKSFSVTSYGFNWVPREVSFPPRVFTGQARFISPAISGVFSNDELNSYLGAFCKKTSYLFFYRQRAQLVRPSLSDISIFRRSRSFLFNNFFFQRFVEIPSNRIIFFQSNGYSQGSVLFSQLGFMRLVQFSRFRYNIFFRLFNILLRPVFVNFTEGCRFRSRFFKSAVNDRRLFIKNFDLFWRNIFRQKKPSSDRSSFFALKLSKIFYRKSVKYFFNFFVVQTFFLLPRKFYYFDMIKFYTSSGSFQFNNFRFGSFNPKHTKVILAK